MHHDSVSVAVASLRRFATSAVVLPSVVLGLFCTIAKQCLAVAAQRSFGTALDWRRLLRSAAGLIHREKSHRH